MTAPQKPVSRAELQNQIAALLADHAVERTGGWSERGFEPDLQLLGRVLRLADPANTQAAHVATALDMWVADQFRFAGLTGIVPREQPPHYISGLAADLYEQGVIGRLEASADGLQSAAATLSALVTALPGRGASGFRQSSRPVAAALRQVRGATAVLHRLTDRASTTILGEGRHKQVDVFITRADRGLELAVSTKTLAVSAGESGEHAKNLVNRWEEFDGDLKNLRGRFPLAVIGAILLVSEHLFEAEAFASAADMLSKLTAQGRPWVNAYDATAILIASPWQQGQASDVRITRFENIRRRHVDMPESLSIERFFTALLTKLFERAPTSEHRAAREHMLQTRLRQSQGDEHGNSRAVD